MGKFNNKTIVNEIDNVVSSFKERLKNTFYNFVQQKGTVVTYYNMDKNKCTFDINSGLQYASIGKDSPARYNKIKDMILYGIDRIQTTTEETEIGPEAETVNGKAIIPPNTIIPYPGDYFRIGYMNENVLFKVISAQGDTMDNGANIYEIEYEIEWNSDVNIEQYNLSSIYTFVPGNLGTNGSVMLEDDFNLISKIETVVESLRNFYCSIFYSDRVQSFIFCTALGYKVYDSFTTEFIIRNKLMASVNNKDYIYVSHQLALNKTFDLDYDKSIYARLEDLNRNKLGKCNPDAHGYEILSNTNIFSTRYETYFSLTHEHTACNIHQNDATRVRMYDNDLIPCILEDKLSENFMNNIIIKYFNNKNITSDDLDAIDNIDMKDNYEIFFYVPS